MTILICDRCNYSTVLTVGFNETGYYGIEGVTVTVCVEILAGVLGPGIVLDYTINAPREDPDLPLGRVPDTATGMLLFYIVDYNY